MHEKKALRGINPGFALDHMEPMRPVVDRAVLQLINAVTFTGADFSIQHDGVCRMNPELARRVSHLALERCSVSGNRSQIARRTEVESPSSPYPALKTAT
jgi:CRISPR/Cas system-associated endonuclease Cas1